MVFYRSKTIDDEHEGIRWIYIQGVISAKSEKKQSWDNPSNDKVPWCWSQEHMDQISSN